MVRLTLVQGAKHQNNVGTADENAVHALEELAGILLADDRVLPPVEKLAALLRFRVL